MAQNHKKPKLLEQLKLLYIFIFALTIILVVPTHIFPPPSFENLRFPHYLEMMKPFLGISWPASFKIYHFILVLLALVGTLNVLGIIYYPKWKKIAYTSSFAGLFLIFFMLMFFLFLFINVNPTLSLIYSFYSLFLLIVDALTFYAFRK